MSAPISERNPWKSMADVLINKTPVATLATAIENHGIQTYDRFSRRISATDDGPDVKVSKAWALDCLAAYHDERLKADEAHPRHPESDPDRWFEYESPFFRFGWPKDELPDFEKITSEAVPESLKPKKPNIDAPVLTRSRRTYLTIIAALCMSAGISYKSRGGSQRIKEVTEKLGFPVDDGTIQSMLKEIPEALEARSK